MLFGFIVFRAAFWVFRVPPFSREGPTALNWCPALWSVLLKRTSCFFPPLSITPASSPEATSSWFRSLTVLPSAITVVFLLPTASRWILWGCSLTSRRLLCQSLLSTCRALLFRSRTPLSTCSSFIYSALSVWSSTSSSAPASSGAASRNRSHSFSRCLSFSYYIIHTLRRHIIDLLWREVPVMTVDSSLLIERLLADVASVCICEFLVCFNFDSWSILDVGSWVRDKYFVGCELLLPRGLTCREYFSLRFLNKKEGTCVEVRHEILSK